MGMESPVVATSWPIRMARLLALLALLGVFLWQTQKSLQKSLEGGTITLNKEIYPSLRTFPSITVCWHVVEPGEQFLVGNESALLDPLPEGGWLWGYKMNNSNM